MKKILISVCVVCLTVMLLSTSAFAYLTINGANADETEYYFHPFHIKYGFYAPEISNTNRIFGHTAYVNFFINPGYSMSRYPIVDSRRVTLTVDTYDYFGCDYVKAGLHLRGAIMGALSDNTPAETDLHNYGVSMLGGVFLIETSLNEVCSRTCGLYYHNHILIEDVSVRSGFDLGYN